MFLNTNFNIFIFFLHKTEHKIYWNAVQAFKFKPNYIQPFVRIYFKIHYIFVYSKFVLFIYERNWWF